MGIFIYGLISYVIGLAGLSFFFLFLGGWDFLPFHINSGEARSVSMALIVNLGIMLLFGLQHSVMARQGFKKWWTRFIPEASERSTYVLLSGIFMFLICFFWQPLPGTVWRVESGSLSMILMGLHIAGWLIAVLATFLINHFELMGLQQVYCHLRKQALPPPTFTDRFLYKVVRHPLQFGLLMGMWITPVMSMTHFMLSLTMTLYILVGLYYEERDLVTSLGKEYEAYQERVRMLVPLPK